MSTTIGNLSNINKRPKKQKRFSCCRKILLSKALNIKMLLTENAFSLFYSKSHKFQEFKTKHRFNWLINYLKLKNESRHKGTIKNLVCFEVFCFVAEGSIW